MIPSSLFTALVEPRLTYCVEVYKSNLHPLYVKQKHVIRLACKTGFLEHTAELFKSLYVLPFYDLIKYKIAIFMYKAYHKMLQKILIPFVSNSNYQTRQSKKCLGFTRTNKKQRYIAFAGACIWNFINLSLKMSRDLKIIKEFIKKSLMY